MFRNIPLLIAFSVVAANAAALPADKPESGAKRTPPSIQRAVEKRTLAVPVKQRRKDVVAMAPTEAEVSGWRVKVTDAGPGAEARPGLSKPPETGGDFSVLGMLAAALGLGAMSITRRMGRL